MGENYLIMDAIVVYMGKHSEINKAKQDYRTKDLRLLIEIMGEESTYTNLEVSRKITRNIVHAQVMRVGNKLKVNYLAVKLKVIQIGVRILGHLVILLIKQVGRIGIQVKAYQVRNVYVCVQQNRKEV